jgi:hypothetical protein
MRRMNRFPSSLVEDRRFYERQHHHHRRPRFTVDITSDVGCTNRYLYVEIIRSKSTPAHYLTMHDNGTERPTQSPSFPCKSTVDNRHQPQQQQRYSSSLFDRSYSFAYRSNEQCAPVYERVVLLAAPITARRFK